MSAKYKKVADAMWEHCMDWLVSKHSKEIINLYESLFDEYLTENYGTLNDDARRDIIKELLKNVIS